MSYHKYAEASQWEFIIQHTYVYVFVVSVTFR